MKINNAMSNEDLKKREVTNHKITSQFSDSLIDVFEIWDIENSNNLTESVILDLQKFLTYHQWVATIELTIWTSREQIDALLKWLEKIMKSQWIDIIDHQDWFITIETDIYDSPEQIEILGNSLKSLIWVKWVQVNILSNLYDLKHTLNNIQEVEQMIL